MEQKRLQQLLVLLVSMVALPVHAAVKRAADSDLTSDEIVLGIICILTGLFLCFAGYRVLSVLLFLTGFYVGYWVCFAIMTNVRDDYGENGEWVVFGTSVAAGILVGLLLVWLQYVGIFMLGALAGFFLAVWILSIVPAYKPIQQDGYQWILICGMALVFAIIALVLKKVVIIIASAFIGSYLFYYGVDIYANTGFYEAAQDIVRGERSPVEQLSTECIIMLVACIATAVLGTVVQLVDNKKRDHHSKDSVYVQINS